MNKTTKTQAEYLTIAQKAIATAIARGETLFTKDGYTIEPYADRPGIYSVARPINDPRPLREGETLWNDVDVVNQDCTCRCYEHRNTCKHLTGVNQKIAEAARLMAPMLPWTQALAPVQVPVQVTKPMRGSEEYRRMVAADFG